MIFFIRIRNDLRDTALTHRTRNRIPPSVALFGSSGRQFFAVRQMVAIPTHQRRVAGVFKEKFQRRRFDVAVAKDHVGFALVAGDRDGGAKKSCERIVSPKHALAAVNLVLVAVKTVSDGHHFSWTGNFRFSNGGRSSVR